MWPSRASIPIAATAPSTVTNLRPHFPARLGPHLGFFPGSRFEKPKCLAVDVDGCLIRNGAVNDMVLEFVQEKLAEGWGLLVWSMRGEKHAKKAAKLAGLDSVAICASKPGCVVDDRGLDWLREVDLVTVGYGEE